MKRSVLLLTLVTVLITGLALPSHGCTCSLGDGPADMLDSSGGAFVGTLSMRIEGQMETTYLFEVHQWVKSDLGPDVEAVVSHETASCGWEEPLEGEPLGVLLNPRNGQPIPSVCTTLDDEEMLRAAETYEPGQFAADPLTRSDIGLESESPRPRGGIVTARIALGVIAAAAVASATVAAMRRRPARAKR